MTFKAEFMEAKILTEVAEIELHYKSTVKPAERPKISRAKDAYQLFLQYWDKNKIGFIEQFKILLLNRRNCVLGICDISTGGVAGTYVDVKLIFVAALKANASGVILCHNHPSGELNPSGADKQLTEKLKEGGLLLDLPIMDHLVITEEAYFSFAEEGLL